MNRRYRKTIIAANWKMNKLPSETKDYISRLKDRLADNHWCEAVICVPFTHIQPAVRGSKYARLQIGAQNCSDKISGAFTGEVSCDMLADLGVKYVIIGHSERRNIYGETNEVINRKVHLALEAGLRPILCVGEKLEARDVGAELDVIRQQVKACLYGVQEKDIRRIVLAYEPVWAIGTGRNATPDQANAAAKAIREVIRQSYNARIARAVSILYGGSMNPGNAAELLACPDIDGGLIGGAGLNPDSFWEIIEAANQEPTKEGRVS